MHSLLCMLGCWAQNCQSSIMEGESDARARPCSTQAERTVVWPTQDQPDPGWARNTRPRLEGKIRCAIPGKNLLWVRVFNIGNHELPFKDPHPSPSSCLVKGGRLTSLGSSHRHLKVFPPSSTLVEQALHPLRRKQGLAQLQKKPSCARTISLQANKPASQQASQPSGKNIVKKSRSLSMFFGVE